MLYVALLLATLRRALRARRDLLIENLALRQQLAVYTRQTRRPHCVRSHPCLLRSKNTCGHENPVRPRSESRTGSSDRLDRVHATYEELVSWHWVRFGYLTPRSLDHLRAPLALRLDLVDEAEGWFATGLEWAERERCPVEYGRNQRFGPGPIGVAGGGPHAAAISESNEAHRHSQAVPSFPGAP